jgi:hypothetical protein
MFAGWAKLDGLMCDATSAILRSAAAERCGRLTLVAHKILTASTVREGVLLAVLLLTTTTERCVATGAHETIFLVVVFALSADCFLAPQAAAYHSALAMWISRVRPATYDQWTSTTLHTNHITRAGREIRVHRLHALFLRFEPLEQVTAVALEAAQGDRHFVEANNLQILELLITFEKSDEGLDADGSSTLQHKICQITSGEGK